MFGGPYTVFPKEIQTLPAAVPFASMTAITTVDTELAEITVANTTASTITLTVEDTQGSPQPILYQINIDPNQPVSLQFDPPQLFKGGAQWQASATGLVGSVRGRSVLGLLQGTDSNGNKIPV